MPNPNIDRAAAPKSKPVTKKLASKKGSKKS
jgi:hypothetical protein